MTIKSDTVLLNPNQYIVIYDTLCYSREDLPSKRRQKPTKFTDGLPKPEIKFCNFDPLTPPQIVGLSPVKYETIEKIAFNAAFLAETHAYKIYQQIEIKKARFWRKAGARNEAEAKKVYIRAYKPYKEGRRFIYQGRISTLEDFTKDVLNTFSPKDVEDTIFVAISKSAKKKDIMDQIEIIVDKFVRRTNVKIRDDKWKYYLIVYDLREKGSLTFDSIANILTSAYPKTEKNRIKNGKKEKINASSENLFTEKNIENFWKTALTLINGKYKEYLQI
jgi:hypothetical protein